MFDIISHIFSAIPHTNPAFPSLYRASYTYNVANSEPFGLKYRTQLRDWDIGIAAMLPIFKSKLHYHELEFHSSKLSPVFRECRVGDSYQDDVIHALTDITGIKHLTTAEMQGILHVREMSLSYGLSSYYTINQAISFYVSSGIGLVKIVQYQGFRRYSEDLYGSMIRLRFGISFLIKPGLESYVGYSHRKDFWKYKTDTIYDEEGNSIFYTFEDLKFSRHGFEIGIKFIV